MGECSASDTKQRTGELESLFDFSSASALSNLTPCVISFVRVQQELGTELHFSQFGGTFAHEDTLLFLHWLKISFDLKTNGMGEALSLVLTPS